MPVSHRSTPLWSQKARGSCHSVELIVCDTRVPRFASGDAAARRLIGAAGDPWVLLNSSALFLYGWRMPMLRGNSQHACTQMLVFILYARTFSVFAHVDTHYMV